MKKLKYRNGRSYNYSYKALQRELKKEEFPDVGTHEWEPLREVFCRGSTCQDCGSCVLNVEESREQPPLYFWVALNDIFQRYLDDKAKD